MLLISQWIKQKLILIQHEAAAWGLTLRINLQHSPTSLILQEAAGMLARLTVCASLRLGDALHLAFLLRKSILMRETKPSYYTQNKVVKTFPTAFIWQPLSPSGSFLENVPLLLRFRFWHFEINRRQGNVFFWYSLVKMAENTSIRPAEDLTQETEGSIRNEWSSSWGSTQHVSVLSSLKSSKYTSCTSFPRYIDPLKYTYLEINK